MVNAKEYFSVAREYLEKARSTQREAVMTAAKMMSECMLNDGIVQLFGVGHNRTFSMELGYRAGGLMPFHQFNPADLAMREGMDVKEIRDPNFFERSDIVDRLWNLYNIDSRDMFIIICDAGVQKAVIDFAMKVKANNHKLIVVTSMEATTKLEARHESGKKLYQLADLVIDCGAPYPDTVLSLNDQIKINQVSGICGNIIAQMITAETYNYLTSNGHEAPVLLSANVTGADVHNRAISDKYLGRWNS